MKKLSTSKSINFHLVQVVNALFISVVVLTLNACGGADHSRSQDGEIENKIEYEFNLLIGSIDQSEDYLLARPIGIRTDSDGFIYIADRGQMKIKKFTSDGEFVENIGKRGRGPSEFQDINMFEITPDENFMIVDRGNLRYSSVSKDGDQLFTEPITMAPDWQFYPDDIEFYADTILSLFLEGASIQYKPLFERELFYLHSSDFSEKIGSFFTFGELDGLDDNFSWINFLGRPGSFVLNPDKNKLFYSPQIYTGVLYTFIKNGKDWSMTNKISGIEPFSEPYTILTSDEYDKLYASGVPGLRSTYYDSPEPYIGRVNSADAGIFILNDGGLVQFRSEWRDGFKSTPNSIGKLDVSVQIFNSDYEIEEEGYLFSLETSKRNWKPLVNWKDSEDNFYLLDSDENGPIVRRFVLKL